MKKLILLVITLLVSLPLGALAINPQVVDGVEIYNINFDASLVDRGYTISSPDNSFRLGVFPNVLSGPSEFVLKKRNQIGHPLPEGKVILSDYWEFDVVNKEAYDGEKPIIVQMEYQPSEALKTVVFWNGQSWQELPSKVIDAENRIIRAYFHLPYARFIVLGDDSVMSEGDASWYRYKECDCAASPDYPKGTWLKVTNPENDKSVEVKVNDYGPDRSIHPDRVIDLDLVAFSKIANKRDGLVWVLVEPVL